MVSLVTPASVSLLQLDLLSGCCHRHRQAITRVASINNNLLYFLCILYKNNNKYTISFSDRELIHTDPASPTNYCEGAGFEPVTTVSAVYGTLPISDHISCNLKRSGGPGWSSGQCPCRYNIRKVLADFVVFD